MKIKKSTFTKDAIKRQYAVLPPVFAKLAAICEDEGKPMATMVEHILNAVAFGDLDLKKMKSLGHYRALAKGSDVLDVNA